MWDASHVEGEFYCSVNQAFLCTVSTVQAGRDVNQTGGLQTLSEKGCHCSTEQRPRLCDGMCYGQAVCHRGVYSGITM